MAGVKGRSGGARPNAGGARAGAGRPKGSKNKPKGVADALAATVQGGGDSPTAAGAPGGSPAGVDRPPAPDALAPNDDPLEFLLGVMNNAAADPRLRVRAAIAAVQYKHTKRGDGGVKDGQAEKAKKAAGGKFAAAAPPRLVSSR